jgi:hypothetical protein
MRKCAGVFQVLLFTPLLNASFETRWQQFRDQNPHGVALAVSMPKTTYFLGEPIPLQLTFTASQPRTFLADSRQYDRVGRMNYVEEFLVDPAVSTEDPLLGLPAASGGMGGLSGGQMILSDKPFAFERLLNEWVRFRKPGNYRFYVLSHRVDQTSEPARSDDYLRMYGHGKPVELASNMLTIEISPAPASWAREQIADAVKVLDGPVRSAEERRRAANILRFLDSPEAAAEMARRMGQGMDVETYQLHLGVLGSPYRARLLPLLEQHLAAPDQPVWDRYLDTITQLAELVAGGPMAPFPKDEPARQRWIEESKQRAARMERQRQQYIERVVSSLGTKQPDARAITMDTLLGYASASPPPSWLPNIVAAFTKDFLNLPATVQSDLLGSRWSLMRSPAMLPILRNLYDKPPEPGQYPPIQEIVLEHLSELAPAEARQMILAEIRNPKRGLPWQKLASLPDRHIPELDALFTAHALAGHLDDRLILRYATGDIVQPIEQAYLRMRPKAACASPLVFYFLRYDPAFGEPELRRNLSTPGGPPVCYDLGFQFLELGSYAMSPALERLAIEYLSSPHVPIKRGMAEILGKYGSAAAEEPLWKTMEYFRSWWRGREVELKDSPLGENARFEQTLVTALALADAWVLTEAGLNRLLGLCTTGACKQETGGWAQAAKPPIRIDVYPGAAGFSAHLAQYDARTAAELRRRLPQYPAGTNFRLKIAAVDEQAPASRNARDIALRVIREAGRQLAP